MFYKKRVLRNFAKFTGKHLCQSLILNKVTGLRPALWHRCFPANLAKFLRTPIFTKHLWWLLLYKSYFKSEFSLYVTEVAEKALSILFLTEAVTQRCSIKNVFLEILQNSQENSCARVSFLIKFSYRTHTLAPSLLMFIFMFFI